MRNRARWSDRVLIAGRCGSRVPMALSGRCPLLGVKTLQISSLMSAYDPKRTRRQPDYCIKFSLKRLGTYTFI